MNIDDHAPSVDLGDYIAVLRRRLTLILVVAGVVVALAMAAAQRSQATYEASVTLIVRPAVVDPAAVRVEEVDISTERQLMLSLLVADRAAARLNAGLTGAQLLEHLKVTVPEGTGGGGLLSISVGGGAVMVVAYQADTPGMAQQTAQTFAEDYLAMRVEQSAGKLKAQLDGVTARLGKAETELREVNRVIASNPSDSVKLADAATRREMLTSELEQLQLLQSRLQSMETDGGSIISAALEPTKPAGSGPIRNGVVAGAGGLLLGVIAAFVRDRTDRRMRTVAQAESLFGRTVLGTVPSFKQRDASLITLRESGGLGGDVFRRLRSKIISTFDLTSASVVVTSARPGEGKSLVATNLAMTLAHTGGRVALVQADFHRPRLHQLFEKPVVPGLAEVLRGEAELDSVLQWLEDDRLAFVAGGAASDRASDQLQSEAMRSLHRELRARFDFVVFDTPALLATGDVLAVAPLADVVVLVASGGYRAEEASAVVMELAQAGAGRIGIVVNHLSTSQVAHDYFDKHRARVPAAERIPSPHEARAIPAARPPRPWYPASQSGPVVVGVTEPQESINESPA